MSTLSQSGIHYPFGFTPPGAVAISDSLLRIRQSIDQILGTRPGERVMRPDFGCGLRSLVFEPSTAVFQALARRRIMDALSRWEPRISIQQISFSHPDDHSVMITLVYWVGAERDSYAFEVSRG